MKDLDHHINPTSYKQDVANQRLADRITQRADEMLSDRAEIQFVIEELLENETLYKDGALHQLIAIAHKNSRKPEERYRICCEIGMHLMGVLIDEAEELAEKEIENEF